MAYTRACVAFFGTPKRYLTSEYSHWNAAQSLSDYLKKYNVRARAPTVVGFTPGFFW